MAWVPSVRRHVPGAGGYVAKQISSTSSTVRMEHVVACLGDAGAERMFTTRTATNVNTRDALRRFKSTGSNMAEREGLSLDLDDRAPREKHRIPQRRASHLLNELRTEQRNSKRCPAPNMKIGDAIQVTVNRGIDSTILLRDVINGNPVEHHIPLYSPLIQSIEVMEEAFIYQGKLKGKRVRPARIYYIRNLDHKFYRITGGGGSDN